MQLFKWDHSLAVIIPDAIIEALDLKEGDEVDITWIGPREIGISRAQQVKESNER